MNLDANVFLIIPDPDCIGKSTAFYTVDDSCTAYYRCENDFRVSADTCVNGTYFNVATGICENESPPGCHRKSFIFELSTLF